MDEIIAEIQEQLNDFNLKADEEVLHKMKELSFVMNISGEDVVNHWIAFSMSKKGNCLSPTLALLEEMEKEEQSKATPKARKSARSVTTPVYNSSNIDLIFEGSKTDHKNPSLHIDKSPVFSPNSMTPTRFTPSRKYSSRSGVGNVVCSFGGTQNVEWNYSSEFSCNIRQQIEKPSLRSSYHYMCEKMIDRAGVLNDMILDAAEYFMSESEAEEWGSIHLPSMEPVSVVGRISSESGERFNASSLLLEGCREHSSGRVVPLDVSRLEQFSFFPGQIIGGTGTNSSGKKFVMNNLYEAVCPAICLKAPDLENCIDSLGVVVAAGPFATSDTFSFEPLWDLMNYVQTSKPHVLILIGPFVDIKNKFIENGEMNETYDDIFNRLVSEILKKIELLSTKVVLVSSSRDAHHDSVYPTPPFSIESSSKRLYLASDPSILNIEGVVFAITSTDILFHMGKEEISHPQLPDRLGRLCGHIITQRNFYPLYPPNEEMNIDFLRYELYAGLPLLPHVLIVPSDFRYFIKDVHGCCCINPERLTKHSSGGTYARIKISNIKKDEYKGSIINAIQAQVLRI